MATVVKADAESGGLSPGKRTPTKDSLRSNSSELSASGHQRRRSNAGLNGKDLVTAMDAIRPEADKNEEKIKELSRLPEVISLILVLLPKLTRI